MPEASSLFLSFMNAAQYANRKMADFDGPIISETLYGELFRGSNEPSFSPDLSKSALALDTAVERLRSKKGVEFRRWVPFIHLGN